MGAKAPSWLTSALAFQAVQAEQMNTEECIDFQEERLLAPAKWFREAPVGDFASKLDRFSALPELGIVGTIRR